MNPNRIGSRIVCIVGLLYVAIGLYYVNLPAIAIGAAIVTISTLALYYLRPRS